MTRKIFGTDGVRGTANRFPMTAEMALRIGMAAGRVFTRGDHRHTVVIGKDTRLSGYMLEPALTAGFTSVGMDVAVVGPMPTPAVAMLTRSMRADLGVMISASHNRYEDNGIKLFGPDGFKLSDDIEREIEARICDAERAVEAGSGETWLAAPRDLGRARRIDDAQGRYIEFAKNSFPKGLTLDGMKIVVDCAHGASYKVAPTILHELGADVVALGVEPDGFNINRDCGSTVTAAICDRVVREGADLGIALDGDADRVILVDERGALVDGDQLMALVARYWAEGGQLSRPGIVATVMSNLGLERFLRGFALHLVRVQVGDRYVVERMRADGYNMGGEQSGHIILTDHATTGDGMIAALQALAVIRASLRPASEICQVFEPLPQILENVRLPDRINGSSPLDLPAVKRAIAEGTGILGEDGRLLIRASGTEPVIRVMGEGEDAALVKRVVSDIVREIEAASPESAGVHEG